MTTSEWAAVVGAGAAVGLLLTVIVIAVALVRTLRDVRGAVADIRTQVLPFITDTRLTLEKVDGEMGKVSEILDTATSVSDTVDSASKLAYSVFSNPFIKSAAFATGLSRGVKTLAGSKRGK